MQPARRAELRCETFAAWIGLVPRQNSTGGKERLGSISKQGDRYLRRLFVLGAIAIVGTARMRPEKYPWVIKLLTKPAKPPPMAGRKQEVRQLRE